MQQSASRPFEIVMEAGKKAYDEERDTQGAFKKAADFTVQVQMESADCSLVHFLE